MRSRRRSALLAALGCLWLAAVSGAEAQDGPEMRLETDPGIHLEAVWRRPLGSGYSGVAVTEGRDEPRGVVLFSEPDRDVVLAFDPETGRELWRYDLGPRHPGRDGSADGPIGTAALSSRAIVVLSPWGRLVALDPADGSELWSRRMNPAAAPLYGFGTTPVIDGARVVVQPGAPREGSSAPLSGPSPSVLALDLARGEPLWSWGDDTASYHSPVFLELLGRRQLVVVTDHWIAGLDPPTGEELWRYRHTPLGQGGGGSGTAWPLGEDRLLIKTGPSEIALLSVAPGSEGVRVEEIWRSRRLFKRSHAAPVLHQGHLYGFDAHFLTCADAANGEVVWKSRSPGGRGLILVDDHLVILGTGGHLVVVRATREGYREVARLDVLEHDAWTPPTYARGSVFVRNLEDMARVRLTFGPDADRARTPISEAVSSAERTELVHRATEGREDGARSGPRVEPDGRVTFVYRGEAQDVAVSGNFTQEIRRELPLRHVPGTDLYTLTVELDPTAHYEYRFHVDFGPGVPDPRNPFPIESVFGPGSELRMPGWPVPEILQAPAEEVPRGRRLDASLRSEILGREMSYTLYLPAGRESGARETSPEQPPELPLLVVQTDAGWESAHLEALLDRVIAGGKVAPLAAVFLPRLRRSHDVAALDAYGRAVVDELLPRLEARHPIRTGAAHRAAWGAGGGAPIAAWLAVRHPGVFGHLALQSFFLRGLYGPLGAGAFSLHPELQEALLREIRTAPRPGRSRPSLSIYLDWSERDSRDLTSGLDVRRDSLALLGMLRDTGYPVAAREVPEAPGWGSWRARLGDFLETFFPAPGTNRSPELPFDQ